MHRIAQNTYFTQFAQNRQRDKMPILRRFGEFHVLFFGEIQNFIFFYAEKADNVRRTRTENTEKTGLTNQTECDKMNSNNKESEVKYHEQRHTEHTAGMVDGEAVRRCGASLRWISPKLDQQRQLEGVQSRHKIPDTSIRA